MKPDIFAQTRLRRSGVGGETWMIVSNGKAEVEQTPKGPGIRSEWRRAESLLQSQGACDWIMWIVVSIRVGLLASMQH